MLRYGKRIDRDEAMGFEMVSWVAVQQFGGETLSSS
jgi:hypothetical protein